VYRSIFYIHVLAFTQILKEVRSTRYAASFSSPKSKNIFMLHVMLSVFPHPNLKISTTRYAVSFTRTSNSLKCKKIFMLSVLLSLYQEMELFGRFVTESEFPRDVAAQ